MTPIRLLWLILALIWLAGEGHIALRFRRTGARNADDGHDRGSLQLLWGAALLGIVAALIVKGQAWGAMTLDFNLRQGLALSVFGAGVGLRFWAATLLGQFFTHRLQIHSQHRLVCSGPYRWIRHPSYTGMLLAFAAAGMAMGDWFALILTILPVTFAVTYRVRIEEAALSAQLPDAYGAYQGSTCRLIPFIY